MPTTNHDAFLRAAAVMPGGVSSPVRAYGSVGGDPRFLVSAHGPYVVDVEGREYVDLVASWGPAILGHAHPEVVAAVQEAAARGLSFGAPTLAEVELAEEIARRVPFVERLRLVSTGTEATMTAVRLARGITGRPLVVKFAGCYHGHSDGLLAAAGSGVATAGLPGSAGVTEATAAETLVLPYNDLAAVRAAFAAHGHRIAAVITEAQPANMGVVPSLPDFDPGLRRITAEHGALLIWDEVLTGFRVGPAGWWGIEAAGGVPGPASDARRTAGREPGSTGNAPGATGRGPSTASATWDWAPDLVTFGKVVGGGLPVAAVGGPAATMDRLAPLGPVYQAGTLSGNPVAVAAGLATLRLADAAVYERLDAVADVLRHEVGTALDGAGVPHRLQHTGNLFSVFFGERAAAAGVLDYAAAKAQDTAAYTRFFHAMLDAGVALPPSAFEAWFVTAAHDDDAVARIVEALPAAARAAGATE